MAKESQVFHCNKCGRYHQEHNDDHLEGNFFHTFQTVFGYGSVYDDDKLSFVLCELCLFDLIKDFKHTPKLIADRPIKMEEQKPYLFDYNYVLNSKSQKDSIFKRDYDRIKALPKK